jgi:hypothetical protein
MERSRPYAAGGLHLDLDLLVVEFARAQLAAESFFGRGAGTGAHQRIEHAAFRGLLRARLHVLALLVACQRWFWLSKCLTRPALRKKPESCMRAFVSKRSILDTLI